MARRVEATELYGRISPEERGLVEEVTALVVGVAGAHDHHGAVVAMGGQLNKRGVRKDIDLKVCATRETNTRVFREEIEKRARLELNYFIRAVLVGNAEVPSLMIETLRPGVALVHLILPSHSHDLPYPESLRSLLPLVDREKYAVVAEF